MSVQDICKIFSDNCNYNIINADHLIMRNKLNGITLLNALIYRFQYAFLDTTKESITSDLNICNKVSFTRQAYDAKERNIPLTVYSNICNDLLNYYDNHFNKDVLKLIGVDGTYNRDSKYREQLNMGLFDISNSIPIELKSFGQNGKNKEIQSTINIITNNPLKFKSVILVADRAYYSCKFLKFLEEKDIKYIIRVRGKSIFSDDTKYYKSHPNYQDIMFLKDKIRIIKCESSYEKTIFSRKENINHKRNIKKVTKTTLTVKNECILITNLLDAQKYDDDKCLNIYRSRWDIETFFKFIKHDYKFSFLTEDNNICNKKSYYCMMIIELIIKIICKKYTIYKQTNHIDFKINRSNIIKGIRTHILNDMINNNLSNDFFLQFCKSYIIFIKVNKDRSYPRISKKPFSKWYVKNYSVNAELKKIIKSIKNNDDKELNKNQKVKAKLILKIDGKDRNKYLK